MLTVIQWTFIWSTGFWLESDSLLDTQMNKTGEKRPWWELGGLVIPFKSLMVVLIQIPVVASKTVKEDQSQTEIKVMKIDFIQ